MTHRDATFTTAEEEWKQSNPHGRFICPCIFPFVAWPPGRSPDGAPLFQLPEFPSLFWFVVTESLSALRKFKEEISLVSFEPPSLLSPPPFGRPLGRVRVL